MKAAVPSGGVIELREWPEPRPGPGELLLRVRGCGLCGSDIAKTVGAAAAPAVLGHEVVGEVKDGVIITAGGAAVLAGSVARVRDGGTLHYFAGGAGDSLPVPLGTLYHRELIYVVP